MLKTELFAQSRKVRKGKQILLTVKTLAFLVMYFFRLGFNIFLCALCDFARKNRV